MQRTSLVSMAVLAIVALIASSAGARPADADLQVVIGVAEGPDLGTDPTVPNGGTRTVTRRTFLSGGLVTNNSPQPARATVRFELSDGLRWGATEPARSVNCTGTPTTAECQTASIGQGSYGWAWDVIASKAGRYTITAEITATSTPDPVLSNNASRITVIFSEAVLAAAAKITPAKPKAGSLVSASVEIFTLGAAVRPTALRCSGSLAGSPLVGSPRATKGRATCLYHPPRSAKGRSLRGVVSFAVVSETIARKTFSKRFAVRLG